MLAGPAFSPRLLLSALEQQTQDRPRTALSPAFLATVPLLTPVARTEPSIPYFPCSALSCSSLVFFSSYPGHTAHPCPALSSPSASPFSYQAFSQRMAGGKEAFQTSFAPLSLQGSRCFSTCIWPRVLPLKGQPGQCGCGGAQELDKSS